MSLEFSGIEDVAELAVLAPLRGGDKNINELMDITDDLEYHKFLESIYVGAAIASLAESGKISKYQKQDDGVLQIYCHIEKSGKSHYNLLYDRFKQFNGLMMDIINGGAEG